MVCSLLISEALSSSCMQTLGWSLAYRELIRARCGDQHLKKEEVYLCECFMLMGI